MKLTSNKTSARLAVLLAVSFLAVYAIILLSVASSSHFALH
jgi:NADH:ubiquinone oxidoreductase subunit H